MKSIPDFETARLTARQMLPSDFGEMCQMNRNPQVMATLGGPRTGEQTRELFQANLDHFERHGYGLWMFYSKPASAGAESLFVGRGGLRNVFVGGRDEVEVGYALMPQFWGRGLATEIAAASVNVAFAQLGLPELVSFTLPTNLASRRVMKKCGFTFERDIVWKELPHVLYRLERSHFSAVEQERRSCE
jgi:ribosomal-protein-alanine N-acetyltransferase